MFVKKVKVNYKSKQYTAIKQIQSAPRRNLDSILKSKEMCESEMWIKSQLFVTHSHSTPE